MAQTPFVVGWHTPPLLGVNVPVFDDTPDTTTPGISAVLGFLQGGYEVRDTFNSADGTYGTLDIPGGAAGSNAVLLRTENDARRRLDVSITNNLSTDITLERLRFDFGRSFTGGPRTLSVFVLTEQGDLELKGFPSVYFDEDTPVIPFGATDYPDVDADLTGLADHVLAPGETAAFRFQVADADNAFTALVLDNIAFTGTIAPGPTAPAIEVDPSSAIVSLDGRTAGLNLLYVSDDDARRDPGALPLDAAMLGMGVSMLRYPGGEVSDNFLWSSDGTPDGRPTLLEPQGQNFITGVPGVWDAGAGEFTDLVVDFDEFMAIAQTAGATTLVCLPFDRMFNAGGTTVDPVVRQHLVDNAVSMIRHALDSGYDVDYWQLGNESNLNGNRQDDRTNAGPATAQDYAREFVSFAQAIEAELGDDYADIRLAANGTNGLAWFRDLFDVPGMADHCDMITPHAYQWGMEDWTDYVRNRDDLSEAVRNARLALDQAGLSAADRARIEIGVTEYGGFRFEAFDDADPQYDQADIGRAIVLFEITASLMQEPDVVFASHWVTRWVGNEGDPIIRATDSLTTSNGLTPNGVALSLILPRLSGAFVGTTVDPELGNVNACATADETTGRVSLFIVNRSGSTLEVDASFPTDRFAGPATITTYATDELTPYDRTPVLANGLTPEIGSNGRARVTLLPWSITVLDVGPCNAADVAAPLGRLTIEDAVEFAANPRDLDADGSETFFDVLLHLKAYDEGCP